MKPKTNLNPVNLRPSEAMSWRPTARVTISCSRSRNVAQIAFDIPANGDPLDENARTEFLQKIEAACAKIGILPPLPIFERVEELQNGEEESAAG